MKKDFRTPLGKSLGLGSGRSGTSHYASQILTSMINAPLYIFFIFLVICLGRQGHDYVAIKHIIANPFVASLIVLMLVFSIYHMKLGMQMIIEDYIPSHLLRSFVLRLNIFLCAIFAVLTILSVFKIALGA